MYKLLVLLFIGLNFIACKTNVDDELQGTFVERLTGTGTKNWKLTFAEARDSDEGRISLMAGAFQCFADNILTLNSDGTYHLEDSGIKCNSNASVTSKWAISENPAKITLTSFNLAGQTFENLTLDLETVKKSTFTGKSKNIKYGNLSIDEVELRFEKVN